MKQAGSLKKLEIEQRKNKNLDYIGDIAEFSSIISLTHQRAKSSSLENNINGHNNTTLTKYIYVLLGQHSNTNNSCMYRTRHYLQGQQSNLGRPSCQRCVHLTQ